MESHNLYDVIVIGGGPAGLTAAIYLARAKYRVLVIEKEQFGGQITITDEVVNYPGIGKISGAKLTEAMYNQAKNFGAEFLEATVTGIDIKSDIKTVITNTGEKRCLGILLATGAHPRSVGFKGEEKFKGRGVAYCATCDGEFFTDKPVFVVGGGFAAAEESVFLTKFASHVTILVREDDFTCAATVADKAKNHKKITVLTNTEVEEISGDTLPSYIRYKNNVTGEITEFKAEKGDTFGVFVFVGYTPDTDLVKGIANLDEQGYVITDKSQKTSADGLFAAGDVCIKPLRQVVTATSDGALAATELEKYVSEIQRKIGIIPAQKRDETKVSSSNELFDTDLKEQLNTVFEKMENPLILKIYLDSREISKELVNHIKGLTKLTDKLSFEVACEDTPSDIAPCVRVCTADGKETGLAFHGVPSGHEFSSFILGLYNASGSGQPLDDDLRVAIADIKEDVNLKILVTLSCSMCPDLVVAAQKIASMNPKVTAEVYDIHHFEELRNKYNVMSVPCLVINDQEVSFGKKNIRQVLELIKK